VSIQGQIVNLLLDLQRDFGIAMLFISHNLALVRHLSHRILVMYAGRLVEIAARDDLFTRPVHPYTRALLAAVAAPIPARPAEQAAALGDAGSAPPTTGCPYRDRCAYAVSVCSSTVPPLEQALPQHWVACHRAAELAG
jgi:oligopeptide/dipeptide ABC transporter ATP-binding protein